MGSGLPAGRAAHYARRMREPGAATGALNWYRGMPASLRTPTPAVAVPTTYVWGRSDFALGRAAAERTRRHVVGPYRFVELDAGHWLPETCPEQVATVVLDQVRAVDLRTDRRRRRPAGSARTADEDRLGGLPGPLRGHRDPARADGRQATGPRAARPEPGVDRPVEEQAGAAGGDHALLGGAHDGERAHPGARTSRSRPRPRRRTGCRR